MTTDALVCALCGSNRAIVIHARLEPHRFSDETGYFGLVRCAECSLVYLSPRPTMDQLQHYYPPDYYQTLGASTGVAGSLARRAYNRICPTTASRRLAAQLALVNRYGPPLPRGGTPPRALDVGVGRGDFLERLARMGWDVDGTDFSAESARLASSRLSKPIHVGSFESMDLGNRVYDLVTFWDVLEHLNQPLSALRNAREHLAVDGVLIVGVPNYTALEARLMKSRWPHLDVPRHLFHFTAQTLRRMLTEAGFHQLYTTTAYRLLADHLPRAGLPLLASAVEKKQSYLVRILDDAVELAMTPLRLAINRTGLGTALVGIART